MRIDSAIDRPRRFITEDSPEQERLKGLLGSNLHRIAAEEFESLTDEIKAQCLSENYFEIFRWACGRGDVKSMRFVFDQMPKSHIGKLTSELNVNDNEIIKKFLDVCIPPELTKGERFKDLLAAGLTVFRDIAKAVATKAIRDVAEEYSSEVKKLILDCIEEETDSVITEDATQPLESIGVDGCGGAPIKIPSGGPGYGAAGGLGGVDDDERKAFFLSGVDNRSEADEG